MTNKEMKKPRPNITRSGRSGRKEGKGVNQFESYLKTILTDKQIQVLADAVLTQNIVCLYGAGLGKSTLARIFKSAGIRSVLAPEDCGADADCYTVLDCPGIIALSMKNEPFSNALDKDSFSKEEITASLADVLKRKH